MCRLSPRHRGVVLSRCVAISPRSARAVRPSAAGAPFALLAKGSVPASAWAVCPSAASARSASAPPGSLAPSCPPRSSQVRQLRQRPWAKVFFFRGTRKSSSCAVASKPYPRSVSAVAAMKKDQSLPWQRSLPSISFQPSLVAGFRPVSACPKRRAFFSPHELPSCRLVSSSVGWSQLVSPPSRPNQSLQRTAFGSR